MTTFFDGKNVVNIRMTAWTGTGFAPDWEMDFFNVDTLERIASLAPLTKLSQTWYKVTDCETLNNSIIDYLNRTGDYEDDYNAFPVDPAEVALLEWFEYSPETGLEFIQSYSITAEPDEDED